jgi:diadenosine tetraphosphatase ApaH/serine/threonine PP2A family protein phosphatase
MRVLILSDIHSNIEALDAVLADAADAYTASMCLGDIVGYGASPTEVIARLVSLRPQWMIRGNHDRVCAGLTHAATFSPTARTAIEWTRAQLTPDQLTWLAGLPTGPVVVDEMTMMCHGAPQDEDFYLLDSADARLAFSAQSSAVCLHGHTHAQTVFRLRGHAVYDETPSRRPRWSVSIDRESRYLINPGSVGQPRDGDPRAAYAILDVAAGVIELRRVAYDVASAQRRILDAGLPASLARRLATGD